MAKPKIIIILGQTATGKSDFAVSLAKKFGGEIISADSRQVYKGLDIGSGKITKREMKGIPHHLLDIASPKKIISASDWQKLAKKKIKEIIKRGNIPIIAGGTGFYIQSITSDISYPNVPPNKTLRKELEKLSKEDLFKKLKSLDPKRAKDIDRENPIRLIRAIEIVQALGFVPEIKNSPNKEFDVLQIGLNLPDEILKQKIHDRLLKRMRVGMVKEAKDLHKDGLSWERMHELGLEYRFLAHYLSGDIKKDEMLEKLESSIWQYAKRQKTWFKKEKDIKWFDARDVANNKNQALEMVSEFLSQAS